MKYPDQVPEATRASLHWGPGVKNCLWVFSVWMDKVISPLSTQWVTSSSPSSQAVQSLRASAAANTGPEQGELTAVWLY